MVFQGHRLDQQFRDELYHHKKRCFFSFFLSRPKSELNNEERPKCGVVACISQLTHKFFATTPMVFFLPGRVLLPSGEDASQGDWPITISGRESLHQKLGDLDGEKKTMELGGT